MDDALYRSAKSKLNGLFQQLVVAADLAVDEEQLTQAVYAFVSELAQAHETMFKRQAADFVGQFETQARMLLKTYLDEIGGIESLAGGLESVTTDELLDELVRRHEHSPKKIKALGELLKSRAAIVELNQTDHERTDDADDEGEPT